MSTEPKAGMNLDPEMIAAYIDKRLSPEQRAVVEAALANDPDAYAVLVESMKALDALRVPEVRTASPERADASRRVPLVPKGRVQTARRWTIAAGVLAAAAALVLVVMQPEWLQRLRGDRVDPRVARLVAAVGDERYIEARLTGGFRYGPLRPVNRGADGVAGQNLALLASAGELQKAAVDSRDPEVLHRWGLALVLLGDFSAAVETLEQAAAALPSAPILSDLAGALLAAADHGRPDLLPTALERATEALSKDGQLGEALYNRALALERLQLEKEAIAAWNAFLATDPPSEWAADARGHLSSLQRRSHRDPFRPLGSVSVEKLLADARDWSRLRLIVEREVLTRSCEGSLAADSASQLRTLIAERESATGDRALGESLESLRPGASCAGFAAFAAAADQFDLDNLAPARTGFQSAAALLPREHPLQLAIQYYMAYLDYLSGHYEPAGRGFEAVAEQAQQRHHLALEAHAAWMVSVSQIATGRYGHDALAWLDRSIALAEATGERVLEGRARNQLADAAEYLGAERRLWSDRLIALRLASETANPRLRQSVYGSVSSVAKRRGLLNTSAVFLSERTAAIVERGAMAPRFASAIEEAELALAIGDSATATERIAFASEVNERLKADPRSAANGARLAAARARLALAEDHLDEALAQTEHARGSIELAGEIPLLDLLCTRATALSRLGRHEQAATQIMEASRVLRQRRAGAGSIFGSPELSTINAGIDTVLGGRIDPQVGLELVESFRAALSPLSKPGTASPQSSTTTSLVFKVLPSKTLMWTRDHQQISLHEIPLSRAAAIQLVRRLRAAAFDSTASARPAILGEAYRLLFGNQADWLRAQSSLRIVTDWPIDGLPFASLRDDATGRYLVQDTTLLLVDASVAPGGDPSQARLSKVLVVANPEAPNLPTLAESAAEAASVGQVYESANALLGEKATAGSVLSMGHDADVIHIAAHAIVDRSDGRRSRFVLSGPPLFGEDFSNVDWRHVRVVVLAGCSTAVPDGRPASPLTLASQVLGAGPGRVIATLAPLSDRASRAFFVAFHQRLAAGMTAEVALQATQIAAIEARLPLSVGTAWSQVVVVGE